MSLNIGELVGYIKLDGTGVGQGIQDAQKRMRDGMDKMSSDGAAQGEKTGKTIGQRLSGAFGDSVKELGKGLVAAFAVSKVVSYIRGTIDAASDLAETVNYSSTIFGQNQAVIEGWAKNGARNLGLSAKPRCVTPRVSGICSSTRFRKRRRDEHVAGRRADGCRPWKL